MNFNYTLDLSRIKAIRLKRNLTQNDIAQILNIDRTTYSRYENGKTNITIEELNILSNYYNVSLDFLCKLTNRNNKNFNKIPLDKIVVGQNLKKLRKDKKLYQETLAQYIGTSHSLISEYEHGIKLVSLPYGYAICKKLNYSMDKLYGKIK